MNMVEEKRMCVCFPFCALSGQYFHIHKQTAKGRMKEQHSAAFRRARTEQQRKITELNDDKRSY